MIKFERTYDWDLINKVITHPRIYRHIATSSHPPAKDFEVIRNPNVHFVAARDHYGELVGIVVAHPIINEITWEVHHMVYPHFWGRHLIEWGREFLEKYLFKLTPCEYVMGFIPAHNNLAIRFARKIGMKQVGLIPRGYVHGNNQRSDIVIFGKEKPCPSV